MELSRYGPIVLLALVFLDRGRGLRFLMVPIDFFMNAAAGDDMWRIVGQAAMIVSGEPGSGA